MLRLVFVSFCFVLFLFSFVLFFPRAGVCHDIKGSFTHFQLDGSDRLSLSNSIMGEVGGNFFKANSKQPTSLKADRK